LTLLVCRCCRGGRRRSENNGEGLQLELVHCRVGVVGVDDFQEDSSFNVYVAKRQVGDIYGKDEKNEAAGGVVV